jgi:hypothetical protein
MMRSIARFSLLVLMLVGLPLAGVFCSGRSAGPYLEFPPRTQYVQHAPFSWPVFIGLGSFILLVVGPFVFQGFRRTDDRADERVPSGWFPLWGWLGILVCLFSWVLAWTRFAWMGDFQNHTFTPLWVGYILSVNALTYRRTGRSLLTHQTRSYLMLFPLSALFWWVFEFLNRFVQNWYYIAKDLGAWEYFWYATLPFSTVLPAVTATREWLMSYDRLERRFCCFRPLRVPHPKAVSMGVLGVAGLGLSGIGVWPNILFPMLWISPLLILVSIQGIIGERTIFSPLAAGDWRGIVAAAGAALICGFFWEMWNFCSLAKWKYSIPFVHVFQIFEMPILGYAGYLPFGLECMVLAQVVLRGDPARSMLHAPVNG